MVAGLISKTLSEVHPTLRTNGMGIGNTHRRISLGFLPVNKKNPLVRKYRRRQGRSDLRSYQSLGEDFGSNVREENLLLNGDIDEEDLMDETDGGEIFFSI